MKKNVVFFFALLFGLSSVLFAQKARLKTSTDSLSYAMGILIGSSLEDPVLDIFRGSVKSDILLSGFINAFKKENTQMNVEQASVYFQEYLEKSLEKVNNEEKVKNSAFLEENKKKTGIIITPSGLQYKEVKPGDGSERPDENSNVTLKYKGFLVDGTEVDNSEEVVLLSVLDMLPGLSEGIQLMTPGSQFIFYIPSELAYNEYQMHNIKPFSILIYEVELISIERQVYENEFENYISNMNVGDYKRTAVNPSPIRYTDGEEVEYSYEYNNHFFLFFRGGLIVLDASKKEVCRMDTRFSGDEGLVVVFYESLSGEGNPLFMGVTNVANMESSGAYFYVLEKGIRCVGPKEMDLIIETNRGLVLNPLEAIRFAKKTDGIYLTFEGSTIVYNPNGEETQVSTKDLHYIYSKAQWTESGAATQLTYFRRLKLMDELLKKKPYSIAQFVFGDVDNDGQDDLVYVNKEDNKLVVNICQDYKIVKIFTQNIQNQYEFVDVHEITNGEIQIYEFVDDKHVSRTFVVKAKGIEEIK